MPQSYFAIIPHPTERKILLTPDSNGWTLPVLTLAGDFFAYVTTLAEQVQAEYGIPATILRCAALHEEDEGEARVRQGVFICENRGEQITAPPGCRWAGKEALEKLSGIPSPILNALVLWFTEAEDPSRISPLRPDWARPGWFADTTEWIHQTLAEQDITPTGPVEQLKTWSISCLLRLSTTTGTVYFKAVPAVFATEPLLTAALAKYFPGETAEVLAVDERRNCLLLRELNGMSLRDANTKEPESELRADTLHRFSAIQIACIGQEKKLMEWGCRSRPLSQLPADIAELMTELDSEKMRSTYGVTGDEAKALVQDVPRIVSTLCDELASFGLPETLLHGDLHGGNVWVTGEGENRKFVFFDWSDGAIAHPFFDLVTFLGTLDTSEEAAVAHYTRNRDAYLEAWTAYLPHDELVRAFTIAQKLAPAYHAISYRYIAQATEPAAQWELSTGVGYYLRKFPH